MRFTGMVILMAALLATAAHREHQRFHERQAAYWRGEFVDDDYDPDYRQWWEKQVPEAERWKPKAEEQADATETPS